MLDHSCEVRSSGTSVEPTLTLTQMPSRREASARFRPNHNLCFAPVIYPTLEMGVVR